MFVYASTRHRKWTEEETEYFLLQVSKEKLRALLFKNKQTQLSKIVQDVRQLQPKCLTLYKKNT